MSEDIDTLLDEIDATKNHLEELRKEYRNRKTAGLRAALEARKDADDLLRQELKELGIRSPYEVWRGMGSLS